ncbi:MAG: hypothetical protein QF466_08215 [Desulfobacterales bacterium]|jgi:hypothetical protein|nr:hypothetical protein [Desulfobacterales bacterium]MDP6471301.1 hypothetical protein [Pseudomonadales bacterium]MDP6825510.1 hypothetical protein [Pseudomonadales bacterium]|tara:strand:- start:1131 stop:1844 length:714 start_codon:yes stop_codon:yes gene_type:complete
MNSTLKSILFAAVGLGLGIVVTSYTVWHMPRADDTRTERVVPAFGQSGTVESFFLTADIDGSGDVVAITGGTIADAFPEGIPALAEPHIEHGLALLTMISDADADADADGKVVGFATELQEMHEDTSVLSGKIMIHTYWTLILPGRGSIFLYQTENNWMVMKEVIRPSRTTGETWRGERVSLNTNGPLPNGTGVIVGGTGEFAGIEGTFLEIGTLKGYKPPGSLHMSMELRLNYGLE